MICVGIRGVMESKWFVDSRIVDRYNGDNRIEERCAQANA